ncbi:MAG: succinate dehydrogenase flavoprotein subunit [Symbiobacteriia bacterium]
MAQNVVVVGGGLAGLMTTIKLAEAGVHVDLISLVPVKRSHSVCAQGGINGAVNTKGEGDSPWVHLDDTVYGGDFLANQPPVKVMTDLAPGVINMFDRMGVTFNRTPEGLLDFRRFGGTKHHRTAFAGATTGQQLMYALDEQVRRWEVDGLVTKYEFWDLLSLVIDGEGRARGIVAQDLRSMSIRAFPGDAVVIASGGLGMIYGKSTNSVINTGAPISIAYQQGAKYGNPEMVQVHPTTIPAEDKLRLMSESIRGEGGRVWTYKDGKPWYFLEEKFPAYGNLVPRDVATREIFDICINQKLGVDGQNMVYLDISHLDPEMLERKLGGVIDIYKKFVGDDPTKVPMKIFPGMHYTMGGIWVDYDQQTNIPGLFAAGESDYSIHGANRLGANSLLSCVTGGIVAGPAIVGYMKGLKTATADASSALFDSAVRQQQEAYNSILKMNGSENAYRIWQELGQVMTENVTVVRFNDKLKATDVKVQELLERWKNIGVNDASGWSNQNAQFTRHLRHMLIQARAIVVGAYNRNESRGSHYKPDFPKRDDANFLKTTIATYNPESPQITYEAVDVSLIPPRERNYA